MAARAYWKGSLKLSLVTCPVMLCPATTSAAKTRFHMINKLCVAKTSWPDIAETGYARP